MRRNGVIAAGVLVAVLLVLGWLVLSGRGTGPAVREPTPAPVPAPTPGERTSRPSSAPRTWTLTPSDPGVRPEPPAPEPDAPPARLPQEAAFDLVRAGDRAMGAGFRACVEPTLPAGSWDLPPLVLNLVVHDGVVVDLELTSPTALDPDVLSCFADAAWGIEFPVSDQHRGTTRIQRTMGLRR